MKPLANDFRWAGLIAATTWLSASVFANTITAVSLSEDKIGPDGVYTIESFSLPTINDAGDVAFGANLDALENGNSDQFESIILNRDGTLHLMAQEDGLAPMSGRTSDPVDQHITLVNKDDTLHITVQENELAPLSESNGLFDYFLGPRLDEDGRIVFRGILRRSSTQRIGEGIWTAQLDQANVANLDLRVAENDDAIVDYDGTTGNNYIFMGNPIATSGGFAFMGTAFTADTAPGVWLSEDPAPETDGLPTMRLISLWGVDLPGSSIALEESQAFVMADSNTGALLATIQHEEGIDATNDQGIWKTDIQSGATLLAQKGDIAPGSSLAFASFGKPAVAANGTVVAWAGLVDENESEGIYQLTTEGNQSLATTSETLSASGQSVDLNAIYDPTINAAGDVAFLAKLDPDGSDGDSFAILKRSASGIWTLIAQTGDQAPGTAQKVAFKSFSSPTINAAGQIAFSATLDGEGEIISNTTDTGVWATDINGILGLVVREGDTLQLRSNAVGTVKTSAIGGFNASGQLALKLGFSNDSSAIVISQIEEAGPPVFTAQPESSTTYNGESLSLSATTSSNLTVTYQWYKDGEPLDGETSATLLFSNPTEETAGDYHVVATSEIGSTQSATASVSILPLPEVPVFMEEPLGDIVSTGGQVVLTARAIASSNVSYQWFKDETLLAGAQTSVLTINNAGSEDDGKYYVIASTSFGEVKSAVVDVLVIDSRLVNISTRAFVGTDANILISGFVVDGIEPKTVLIRGIGPSLAGVNAPTLTEPRLDLFKDGQLIASNNGWNGLPNQDEIAQAAIDTGAFAIPTDSQDAAMLLVLEPGTYGVFLSGENGQTGLGMLEAYEVNQNATQLVNISSRAFVGTGEEILLPGFVVTGDTPVKVLVRGVGPSIPSSDLVGVMQFPILTVINSQGQTLGVNERWWENSNAAEIAAAAISTGAFPLQDGSEDAAMILELSPGSYAAFVTGQDGTTGIALVEVYRVFE